MSKTESSPTIATLTEEEWAVSKRRGTVTDAGVSKIGERLSQLRKMRGITQVEMAEKLGATQSMVSKYETGEFRLHAELIVAFAKILRVSTDQLLGVKDAPELVESSDERGLWKKLRMVAQLPERDQRAVLRLISSVAQAASLRKAS